MPVSQSQLSAQPQKQSSSDNNLPLYPTKMRSVSNDFEEWLIQISDDSWMTEDKKKKKRATKCCSDAHHDDDDDSISFGELSLISINSLNEEECLGMPSADAANHNDHQQQRKKKRVSWGDKVEIREYPVIQGDHPKCTLPLTLDWVSIATIYKNIDECSRERQTQYDSPKRFTLDDRREKLYGSVQANLADFDYMSDSLDMLLRGLDDLLSETTMDELPDLSQSQQQSSSSCREHEPILSASSLPPIPTTTSMLPLPKSLMAYEEFFSSPEEQYQQQRHTEPPVVHWTRIMAAAC